MKKVWVLEGFITQEIMKQWLAEDEELLRKAKLRDEDEREIEILATICAARRQAIVNHPNGYWSGYQGKVIYRQFCEVARETLRNMKDRMKFRVVTAQIEDNAKYWSGYRNPVESSGVLKYLMATL